MTPPPAGSPPAQRPRTLARRVAATALVALGVVAAWKLPLRTFPEPREPTLGIALELATPLSPEEVSRRWVVPLESALRELGGVERISGHVEPGGTHLTAELAPGTDVDAKAARLSGRLRAMRRQLPERALLTIDSASRSAGHVTAVVWVSGPAADAALAKAATRLRALPEINSATTMGAWEEWTRVTIPAGHPDAHGLAQRVRELLADLLEVHRLGEAELRGRRVPLLFAPPDGWRLDQVPVPTGEATLPLAALADIDRRLEPPRTVVRFAGRPARTLVVRREPSASPLRADAVIRDTLDRSLGEGATAFVSWSEAAPLRDLLVRGALSLLLASVLLGLTGTRFAGRRGATAGLAPLLGLAAAVNLLWLARLHLDTATSTALLLGLIVPLPLVPLRIAGSNRRLLSTGGFLVVSTALVPLLNDLAGGPLRWSLAEPALAFSLTVLGATASLLLLAAPGAVRRPAAGTAGRLLRRTLRDPVTTLLAGASAGYLLLVLAGPALAPAPRAVPRNPADLTVHLALPPGSTAAAVERDVKAVERLLGTHATVARHWSVIQPRQAYVFVELTPRGRRAESRNRLESDLRSGVVAAARLDVTAGTGAAGAAGAGGSVASAERLAPALDPVDHTFYRFVLRSADLDTLREAHRRATARLGSLGVGAQQISGWETFSPRLHLRPRKGVAAQEWLPWVGLLERRASPPRPLVLSRTGQSYLTVEVGTPWSSFAPPRLAELLTTASSVERGRSGANLFRLEERLDHPRVARQDGRFAVPVTVRPRLLSAERRLERLAAIEAALRRLPLPAGAELDLPAREEASSAFGPRAMETGDVWRLGALAALLLFTAAVVRTGSTLDSALVLVPTLLAVLAPAPLVLWGLGRADEMTLLALAAAACLTASTAVDSMVAIRRVPGAAGTPTAAYRAFQQRFGASMTGAAVAAGALLPLFWTAEPLRAPWAVPAGVLAVGTAAGLGSVFLALPAAIVAVHRARRSSRQETAALRRPTAWIEPQGPPRLEVRNLVKQYPSGHRALRGVDLALEPGVVGLLGPNGAGKTTLLRTVIGLLQPTRGQVRFRSIAVDQHNQASFRTHVGFLPQELNAYPGVTGEQFLDLWALEKGIRAPRERNREIGRVLELVELTEHAGRKVRQYSGGMRRRIGVAQALLGEPPLLVVDEPTAGMDLESRLQLRRVLRRVSEGRIVLISTHLIGDVDALASRLLFLFEGRVRYDGQQAEFLAAASGHVAEVVVSPDRLDELAARFRVTRRAHVHDGVEVRVLSANPAALPGPAVEPTLEEAYLLHLDLARTGSLAFRETMS